jgi:RNA polymerase sigma-70 factor (ECF subfamily)
MVNEEKDPGAQAPLEQSRPGGGARVQNLSVARRWPVTGAEDEANLALAASRRDKAAFAELYGRYAARVYRYLYSYVGERTEAEDLTAQVFTAAWEGIHRYREQGNFAAWLFRIARNKAGDYYRRRRPQVSLDEVYPEPQVNWDPAAELERGEALHRLNMLVKRLEPEQLELLRLRFAADLSFAEIAGLLGRSEAAVKMAVHRLLHRLQVDWENVHE